MQRNNSRFLSGGLRLTALAAVAAVCLAAGLAAHAQTPVLQFERQESMDNSVAIPGPHPIGTDPEAITVEGWIKWDGATSDPSHAGVWGRGVGGGGWHWEIRSEGMRIRMVDVEMTGLQNPPVDEWAHVAVSHDGSVLRYFLNGELIGSQEGTRGSELDPDPVAIGSSHTDGQRPFGGQMAEFRTWNVNRTEADIQTYMNQRLQGDEPGLVGYWRFDEGSGNVAQDLTGQWADGEIGSNVSWATADDFLLAPVGGWFLQDLQGAAFLSLGQSLTLGPIELREPEGDVTYQWYFNGNPIDGATDNSFTISDAAPADQGVYHVVVLDDAHPERPLESRHVNVSVGENLPVGNMTVLALLAALTLAAGAWIVRRRSQQS